jgi:hypothetical protein
MRTTALTLALLAALGWFGTSRVDALAAPNPTPLPPNCIGDPPDDPSCQNYTPFCSICLTSRAQPNGYCAQVQNADGATDCRTVYMGGTSSSCELTGGYCGNVTVH